MKIKITMPQRYRKHFTVGDMEEIKKIKADPELDETIETALEVAAAGGEILKVTAEWLYNHAEPEATFYGNGVDIGFTVYVLHEYDRFEVIHATMCELYSKTWHDKHCGYGSVYRMTESFK